MAVVHELFSQEVVGKGPDEKKAQQARPRDETESYQDGIRWDQNKRWGGNPMPILEVMLAIR